jgi:MYXO-CTERM domain-containing protein
MTKFMTAIALIAAAGAADAGMRITEWMYSGGGPEFVEFTNLSGSAIDMTGWSYDDDSRIPGAFDLSAFGVVAAGESVVITEGDASEFRTSWGLSNTVKIIGGYTNNLGRNDEINLFNADSALVDRLTYGDQNFPGSIRTQGASGNVLPASIGANDPFGWVLSFVGDVYGSTTDAAGDLGNPGQYIPAPAALALLGLGGLSAARRRR